MSVARYYLIDRTVMTDEEVYAMRPVCEERHHSLWPKAKLGTNTKADGTKTIVKIAGADDAYETANMPPVGVTRISVDEARALVQADGWYPVDDE